MSLLKTSLKKNGSLRKSPAPVPTPSPSPTPTPTPPPSFTVLPSISPSSGQASSTTFTATDGTVINGLVTGRRWLLNGTSIGTGTTVAPVASGSLVLENTATGAGGTTVVDSNAVNVSPASGADPTLPAPILAMGVSQTTFPIKLSANFAAQPLNLTTDLVHLQVATDIAFSTIVLEPTPFAIGTGAQTPGLSGLTATVQRYFRERVERGSAFGPWSNIVTHYDIVNPVLSLPTSASITDTTATVGVTSSKAEGTLYWTVLPSAASAPTAQQFLSSATGGVSSGSTTSPAASTNTFSAMGLTAGTAYKAWFFQSDLVGNPSNINSASFTTTQTAGPTLTGAAAIDGGILSVSTNQANGTLYWFVSTSATPPTGTALKAGTGATSFGNQVVTATGVQNVAAGGLSDGVTYYGYFLQTNSTPIDSTIAQTGSFNGTPVPTAFTTTNGTSKNTYLSVSGSPALTYAGTTGVNAPMLTRALRAAAPGKRAWEQTWQGTGGGGAFWMGWDDGTPDLSGFGIPGNSVNGIALSIDGGNWAIYNGSSTPVQSGQGDPASLVSADTFTSNYDSVAGTVSFYRTRSGVRIQIGTTITITPFTNAWAIAGDTGTLGFIANMGQSTFAYLATNYHHY